MPVEGGAATVGRGRLCKDLVAKLRAGDAGGVLLRGPAGIGKTHLAHLVAAALGGPVVEIMGGAASTTVPLGACANVVPVLAGDVPLVSLLAATVDSLTRRARTEPFTLVADDADLLDDASATLVSHLVGVIGVKVVATARAPERAAAPLAALVHHGSLTAMDIPSLDPEETTELASRFAGVNLEPESGRRIYQLTQGNPLWVIELIRSGASRGLLREGPAGLVVDIESAATGLTGVVSDRVNELDAAQRDAVELLAAAGALPLALLERLTSPETPVSLANAGLVCVEGSSEAPTVRLAHPLHRQCVLAALDHVRTRSLLRRLVDATGDTGPADRAALMRLALWHAQLGLPFDPAALGLAASEVRWGLLHLVRRHLAGQATDAEAGDIPLVAGLRTVEDRVVASYRLAAGAWREDPTFENGLVLARALAVRPDLAASMVETCTALAPLATTDEQRARLAVVQAVWSFWTVGDRAAADADLLRASATLGPPWNCLVTSWRGGLMVHSGAINEGMKVLADAPPPPDAPAYVQAAHESPMAAALNFAGRPGDGLALAQRALPLALGAGDDAIVTMAELVMSLHWAEICLGRYEEAAAGARSVVSLLREVENDEARALFSGIEGRAVFFQGRPAAAAALLEESIRRHGPVSVLGCRPVLHTTRAFALSWVGRVPEAREEAAEARRWSVPPRFFDAELDLAEATVLAAEGRRTRAARMATAAGEAAEAHGAWWYALEASFIALRIQPEARKLLPLEAAALRVQGEGPPLKVAHARALLDGSPQELEHVAEKWVAAGETLMALEALEAAADGAVGTTTARNRLHAQVAQLSDECEGASSPYLPHAAAAPSLTAREMEVTLMAAGGWTSAAIARELVLSVRTVESHLYRAFAKLGVRSREELGQALRRTSA